MGNIESREKFGDGAVGQRAHKGRVNGNQGRAGGIAAQAVFIPVARGLATCLSMREDVSAALLLLRREQRPGT